MYFQRQAEKTIVRLLKQYPAVVLSGPRQSGKSTLAKKILDGLPYVSLENLDERAFAVSDPRAFLNRFTGGGVIDEIQKSPDLLSYLQSFLDEKKNTKPIIITGSAQLTLLASVSQTLAGRVSIVELLPLAYSELRTEAPNKLEDVLFEGMYPKIHKDKLDPSDWIQDYIKTYIERDVRDILKIHDLASFQRFIRMCAARAGQILNISSLANDCGISHSAAVSWLNILETTYIVHRVRPHFKNFSKRLIKSPKLYFYDTGVLCFLLSIKNAKELETHSLRGAIMENWVASEIIKGRFNAHHLNDLSFWRDNKGNEVDFIVEREGGLLPIEVKSGQTVNADYFKGLNYWKGLAGDEASGSAVLFAGDVSQSRSNVDIYGWRDIDKLLKAIAS